MKLNRVLTAVLYLCCSLTAFGQKGEKFDIISYTAPTGWQKEANQNTVQLGMQDQAGNVCLIMMFKPLPGGGDPKANFDAAWKSIVQEAVTVKGKPQIQPTSTENGWVVESGLAQYESDGKTGVALLVAITGDKKMVNILILMNSDAYQAEVSAFLDSVSLPKIEKAPTTITTTGNVQAKNDGYAFNTTNWDDGWTSAVQNDWVLVSKGQMKIHLLYALPYNASQFSGTGVRARDFYWDNYVANYFNVQTKQYRDESSIGSFNAEYVEGTATDRQTGERRFIAMYLSITPNTAWLKIASAQNESALRQQFPNSNKQLESDLSAMSRYNQFPLTAGDVVGRWQDGNTSTAHWYYVSPAGYESYAGMTIASTVAEFNFAAGGGYTSQHTGATGSVGNLSGFRQNYRGTYKVTNWSLSATNRWQGKTDNFKAYFQVMRGGRILVLESAGQTYNLVKAR